MGLSIELSDLPHPTIDLACFVMLRHAPAIVLQLPICSGYGAFISQVAV